MNSGGDRAAEIPPGQRALKVTYEYWRLGQGETLPVTKLNFHLFSSKKNLKRITEQEGRRESNYTMLLTSTQNSIQSLDHPPEISKGIKRTL